MKQLCKSASDFTKRMTASWYAASATLLLEIANSLTLVAVLEVAECIAAALCNAAQFWEIQSALMDVPAGPGHGAQLTVCELQLLVQAVLNVDSPQGCGNCVDC